MNCLYMYIDDIYSLTEPGVSIEELGSIMEKNKEM